MSDVLRVYLPSECDANGVPLGWDECVRCEGTGEALTPTRGRRTCESCDGHGSLKAAALAGRLASLAPSGTTTWEALQRCEDCGHPMSEGTWESGDEHTDLRGEHHAGCCHEDNAEWWRATATAVALARLREGVEPWPLPDSIGVHFSRCDEGCRHGGPGRTRLAERNVWDAATYIDKLPERASRQTEASWRPVDVRCLSWPHDLRPEQLAVLCLRCWAAR